jgi:hypothetical protein
LPITFCDPPTTQKFISKVLVNIADKVYTWYILMYFLKILKDLDKEKVHYAIVGGYAVALHGVVRATMDLDLIINIDLKSFEKLEKIMKKHNLTSRLPVSAKDVYNFREEYIKKRNLVAWSFTNFKKPSEIIDVIITHDLKKMKTLIKDLGSQKIKLLSIEDLIEMKKESGRPQDIEDIKALKEVQK